MVVRPFLYKENKNFPFHKPFVNAATSILSSTSSIERASLLKRGYVRPKCIVLPLLDTHQACGGLLILVSLDKVRGKLRAQLLKVPMELGGKLAINLGEEGLSS